MITYVIDSDNVTELDYLIGDEQYKKDWTPKRRERYGLLVFNKNFKGHFLAFLVKDILPFFAKHKGLRQFKAFVGRLMN